MMQFIPEGTWDLEATPLRDGRFAVRPKGCLGTCGWKGGMAWSVIYVRARSHEEARRKAARQLIYGFRRNA